MAYIVNVGMAYTIVVRTWRIVLPSPSVSYGLYNYGLYSYGPYVVMAYILMWVWPLHLWPALGAVCCRVRQRVARRVVQADIAHLSKQKMNFFQDPRGVLATSKCQRV